ncbi:MAG: non-hydrolyzing UDP-N-acetylglucosamine 2-epimerase [Nitrospirota bacterium]
MNRTRKRRPLTVFVAFGTRPEAIKLAPVIRALWARPRACRPVVCVTGQHREMLNQVLDIFDIQPDHALHVMKPAQSLTELTANVLVRMEQVLVKEEPDLVLVQGDTTTSFAASLAAFYQRIPIGHVEAGLRTLRKYEPFPEEVNRRLTGVLADYHYAPTANSRRNLLQEGVNPRRVIVTGNTGIDALFVALRVARRSAGRVPRGGPAGRRLVLVTAHRRENFGEPFDEICRALIDLVTRNPDVDVVYPVHLNPRVHDVAFSRLAGFRQIQLVKPLDYLSFVRLLDRAYLILTDSGGIQEEAPSLGKPVLVMRDTTERPEAVEAGTARLVGARAETIVAAAQRLLDDPRDYRRMSAARNPFGDGKASERIVRHVLKLFPREGADE